MTKQTALLISFISFHSCSCSGWLFPSVRPFGRSQDARTASPAPITVEYCVVTLFKCQRAVKAGGGESLLAPKQLQLTSRQLDEGQVTTCPLTAESCKVAAWFNGPREWSVLNICWFASIILNNKYWITLGFQPAFFECRWVLQADGEGDKTILCCTEKILIRTKHTGVYRSYSTQRISPIKVVIMTW